MAIDMAIIRMSDVTSSFRSVNQNMEILILTQRQNIKPKNTTAHG